MIYSRSVVLLPGVNACSPSISISPSSPTLPSSSFSNPKMSINSTLHINRNQLMNRRSHLLPIHPKELPSLPLLHTQIPTRIPIPITKTRQRLRESMTRRILNQSRHESIDVVVNNFLPKLLQSSFQSRVGVLYDLSPCINARGIRPTEISFRDGR